MNRYLQKSNIIDEFLFIDLKLIKCLNVYDIYLFELLKIYILAIEKIIKKSFINY